MTVFWDLGARKAAGIRRHYLGTLVRDAGPAFVSVVLVAIAVYLVSWTGWFLGGDDAYLRYWAKDNPGTSLLPDALRSLLHYHSEAFHFHRDLSTFHPYRSNPWGWVLLARPVSYFYEGPKKGDMGCQVEECSRAITALGTPAIWWAGAIAIFVVGFLWIGRRDWRAGAILAGLAGGYLPWFFFQDRTVYSFYSVAFVPWLVLAVTMCLGLILGPAGRVRLDEDSGALPSWGPTSSSRSSTSGGCCRCSPPRSSPAPTGRSGCGGRPGSDRADPTRDGVTGVEDESLGPSAAIAPLGRARLDDLLSELLTRVGDVMDTQDRLRGLLDAVVGIAGDLDLDSVLERIIRVACQLADAQYGALGVLGSGSDRRLRAFITHGLSPEQREKIGDLPRGHGILGVIIDSPEPLRLTTLGEHEKSYGFPPNHPPMNTFLGVPIRIRDKVFGNLYLTEKQSGGGFTVDDEEIVVALAAAAGVAIENARLYEETSRRQRWLEAAAEVTAALLRSPEQVPGPAAGRGARAAHRGRRRRSGVAA